jgi:uncharacterized protein YbjT (DUF2867 family)
VIEQALERGYDVTAYARNPEKLQKFADRIRIVIGNIENVDEIGAAVLGQDAIISTLGTVNRKPNTVLSDGTARIIDAMKTADVYRCIIVTSLGCGDSVEKVPGFIFRELIVKRLAREVWADKNRQEDIIRRSGLDYTLVRPGGLRDGAKTGSYIVSNQTDDLPKNTMIYRADVADFLLKCVNDAATIGGTYTLTS